MRNVDVIIPVYSGYSETIECIVSASLSLPDWANLIVINDCSPDHRLTSWLRDNSAMYRYELHENVTNLGFVATVNFGMQLNLQHDVLLLNSDVEVPHSDWLTRMRIAAYSKDKIGSITPFSNNATICSFPNFCEDNELFLGNSVNCLDSVFAEIQLGDNLVPVPTGVGFCMYIRRDCLAEVGLFDVETFGKGYGEENDWCQRAIKKGWGNYHQLNVFVYHKGGVSFAETGDSRKELAIKLLQELHPNYLADVHEFIKADPAKKARLKACLLLLAKSKQKKVVFVTHQMGGGVAQHIVELENFYKGKVDFFVLRPSGNSGDVVISFPSVSNQLFSLYMPKEYDYLKSFFKYVGVDHFHFHHSIELPDIIWQLPDDLALRYDVTIHDFYCINGNPTQTNRSGIFVGNQEEKDRDSQCIDAYPIVGDVVKWKETWLQRLKNARYILCPSYDTAERIGNEYPSISNRIIKAYHLDMLVNPAFKGDIKYPSKLKKIVVLGALSKEKGADLLESVAKLHPDIDFHLVGYAYRPLSQVITHGAYERENVDYLLKSINPDAIWFPAMCPETYSYTLSIALRQSWPIFAPCLGAFPERLLCRDHSYIIELKYDLSEDIKAWSSFFQSANSSFDAIKNHQSFKKNRLEQDLGIDTTFYSENYLKFPITTCSKDNVYLEDLLDFLYCNHSLTAPTAGEKILYIILKLQSSILLRWVFTMVPLSIQKKLKRMLSRKPILDILSRN